MEQITVRAASTIPEDIVDLAAGVPANELLVIIARNVDEYKRVARLEVEGRVEIQVVDGKGVAELDLKEYQILRLNQLQVMMLFRCLEKYMNGLRLDTINDILEENIAQAILTNV